MIYIFFKPRPFQKKKRKEKKTMKFVHPRDLSDLQCSLAHVCLENSKHGRNVTLLHRGGAWLFLEGSQLTVKFLTPDSSLGCTHSFTAKPSQQQEKKDGGEDAVNFRNDAEDSDASDNLYFGETVGRKRKSRDLSRTAKRARKYKRTSVCVHLQLCECYASEVLVFHIKKQTPQYVKRGRFLYAKVFGSLDSVHILTPGPLGWGRRALPWSDSNSPPDLFVWNQNAFSKDFYFALEQEVGPSAIREVWVTDEVVTSLANCGKYAAAGLFRSLVDQLKQRCRLGTHSWGVHATKSKDGSTREFKIGYPRVAFGLHEDTTVLTPFCQQDLINISAVGERYETALSSQVSLGGGKPYPFWVHALLKSLSVDSRSAKNHIEWGTPTFNSKLGIRLLVRNCALKTSLFGASCRQVNGHTIWANIGVARTLSEESGEERWGLSDHRAEIVVTCDLCKKTEIQTSGTLKRRWNCLWSMLCEIQASSAESLQKAWVEKLEEFETFRKEKFKRRTRTHPNKKQ